MSLRAALLLALTASACALEVRDLDAFRETATGPEKLRTILADGTRATELRAEAGLRLLDLERSDADGSQLLISALRASSEVDRRSLAPTLERGLLERIRTAPSTPPAARAVRIKDLAVDILALLEPESAERLGIALITWIGEDVELRADRGRYTLEQLAAKLGSASAKPSAESVRPGLSAKSLARLTASIEKHADLRMREAAARKVIEVEQSYRRHEERKVDVLAHAIPALGRLADTSPARERLVSIACDAALTQEERSAALALLRGRVTVAEVEPLSAVVLDENADLRLREQALDRLRETRSKEALPTLLALVPERRHRSLREPATVLAIELGGERILQSVFRTLPNHWNVTYPKSELEAYAGAVEQLPPTPYLVTLLGGKLYSPFFWNRVIALRYLANRAHPLEATWRLRLHVEDKQEVLGEGWPAKWTIGREAQSGLRTLAERESRPRGQQ